ncbi:hypothetical protein C7H19_08495 [Aphanothece hegewaldii CCALA 016]|uniref:Uncharacterized protein n=1 Tax=Aphanothece hegewaldii CCALA 016 TaxID=2107694 RepID=A0A2T1LYY7_9CHRO|nr:hypothetical protein [Aphanothece hegewaldii]PSF37588.1 hypothetical protein C7H19_08495 [Aphanothece hegewaldii CCALA 016]
MSDRKEIVRQFYKSEIENAAYVIDGFGDFRPDRRIGRVELLTTGNWGEYGCEADFDSIEIERIQSSVPQTVSEAFERHIWFSQHSLSNIFAFKIPVKDCITYVIGISGIAGDGWDNSGHFIEIFNELGEFLGAARVVEGENLEWLDHPFDGDDFNAGAPKWIFRTDSLTNSDKLWSEEMAVRTEQDGEITRLILFVPE